MKHTFLKRIELQGFKSFAQKTVFEFPSRIVAIVGPNGSGKSNIIDALRWVLGEREAKQLRGGVLENLIFSGTPKRASVGFAKVSLWFDNRGETFLVGAKEVVLSRKVDRSGTSQFFLNDEEIRMKDLHLMLAKARLGSRGLTIVKQGQGDIFVQSSPEERKMMIEEILGLKEFRLKKDQAERQLSLSRINMDKVRAMLEELLPHLRFLRKQKNKWEKRDEIAKELRYLENAYYGFHYGELERNMDLHRARGSGEEDRKKQLEMEISELQDIIKRNEMDARHAEKVKVIRMNMQKLIDEKSIIEKSLARAEVTLEMREKEMVAENRTPSELSGMLREVERGINEAVAWDDIGKIKVFLRELAGEISKFFGKVEIRADKELILKKEKLGKREREISEEIEKMRVEENMFLKKQEDLHAALRENFEALEEKKSRLIDLERRARDKIFEFEKAKIHMEELEKEWIGAGRNLDELSRLPKGKEEINLVDAERKMFRLRGELAAIGEIDENLVQEAGKSEERYKFLSHELNDLENAIKDLELLISDFESRISGDFEKAFRRINEEFNTYFRVMFGGGRARMKLEKKIEVSSAENGDETRLKTEKRGNYLYGVDVDLQLPKKKITSLLMLSGGEKSLVSIAALFALISVSPPPFLVLDEIDAPLDEENARRFAELVKNFSEKTQFVIVTHNRATMEAADALYGVTMEDDGVSKVLSLRFEEAEKVTAESQDANSK